MTASLAGFIRADSGVVGVTLSLVLAVLLVARLVTRELATPLPRLVVRSVDGSIVTLFILFAFIVGERFHVLG